MTNRFTKTSFFVQGGIMRPPSDGGLKSVFMYKGPEFLVTKCHHHSQDYKKNYWSYTKKCLEC